MDFFFIKLNIYFPYDPAIPLIGIHLIENTFTRKPVLQVFIVALFIMLKTGNNPNIPQLLNGSTNWVLPAMEYYLAIIIKKKSKPVEHVTTQINLKGVTIRAL